MSEGPDELHQRLLSDNKNLRREAEAAKAEAKRLTLDPRTGLLRESVFVDQIDALLRRLLRSPGGGRLLRGADPRSLTDPEFSELDGSVVVFSPTYPNPALVEMLGIRRTESMLDDALFTLASEVRPRLSHETVGGIGPDNKTVVHVRKHLAGHLDDRLTALCLAEPARVCARTAREVTEKVRGQTTGRVILEYILPFRIDYGGATFVEALTSAGKFFRRFQRGSGLPDIQVEVVRRLLLGIARERARENTLLASAALQVRLRHTRVKLFDPTFEYLALGESVLDERMQDACIQGSLPDGSLSGPRVLDGAKLERIIEEIAQSRIEARIASLTRRTVEHTGARPSTTQLERLVLLTAHNRLDEFMDDLP